MVSLWDITAGKFYSKYSYHGGDCRSVEFSCDAKWLLSASFDRSLGVFDMRKNESFKLTAHDDRVVCAKWHPFLPICISTSADRTARVFSLQ